MSNLFTNCVYLNNKLELFAFAMCKFCTVHWISEECNLLGTLCVIFTSVDNRYLYAINTSARISDKYRKQLGVESSALLTWEYITKIVTRFISPHFMENNNSQTPSEEPYSSFYPKPNYTVPLYYLRIYITTWDLSLILRISH